MLLGAKGKAEEGSISKAVCVHGDLDVAKERPALVTTVPPRALQLSQPAQDHLPLPAPPHPPEVQDSSKVLLADVRIVLHQACKVVLYLALVSLSDNVAQMFSKRKEPI